MFNFFTNKLRDINSDVRFSEIFRGSVFSLGSKVFATILALGTNIFVARFYGAEMVGLLAILNAFLMLISIFTMMGTGTSILRLVPEHVAKYSIASAFQIYRKIVYLVCGVSLVVGSVFFVNSGLIADSVFGKPHLRIYLAISSVFVLFKSLSELNTQAVRGLQLIRSFAIMQALPQATMFFLLLVVFVVSDQPDAPIYAQFGTYAFVAVFGGVIVYRSFRCGITPEDIVHSVSARKILTISTPMLMTASMQFFIGQSGVVLLGIYRSESEVGYYAIAVKLATLTAFALQAINSMAAPKFSEYYHAGRIDDLFYIARKSAKLIFWATTPILLVLGALGYPMLAHVFGDEFTVAYPVMLLLVIGQFINAISGPNGLFMNMTGMEIVFRNIMMFAAILNILLGVLLAPHFGAMGVAFAGTVCLATWNFAALYYIKKHYGQGIGYFQATGRNVVRS